MRLTKTLLSLSLAVFFTAISAFKPAGTNAGSWRFLGDKNVNFSVDRDVLHFTNWGDNVRQLKIRVTDGPLKMYSMTVHFDNGSTQGIELKNHFAQGSWSRVIDLDGGLRHLTKIEFVYETQGFLKGKSRVAVWGRK
ncbi:MAG: hypothetical protein IPM85_06335 [Chitinophagaceae bacterium]|nr:hypothetical protein [Chitinophagaceae bacterium]